MEPRHLFARYREHAERVVFAEVRLGREGQLGQVGQLLDVVRVDFRRVEGGLVVRYVLVRMTDRPSEALGLQRSQLVEGRGLDRLEIAGARAEVVHADS